MQPSTHSTQPNPVERARRAAARRYPDADVLVRSHRGRPVIVAREGSLIRLIRPKSPR
jgi:hypothetical protein